MAEEIEVKVKVDIDEAKKDLKEVEGRVKSLSKATDDGSGSQKNLGKELISNSKITSGLSKVTGGLSDAFLGATKGVKLTSLSLKGLKSAIISTGIGVLVILVGELISILADFFSAEKKSEKAVNDLTRALDDQAKQFDELTESNNFHNNIALKNAKAEGKSKQELKKINDDYLQSEKNRIAQQLVLLELEHMAILKGDKLNKEDKEKKIEDINSRIETRKKQQTVNLREKITADVDYNADEKELIRKSNEDKIAKQKAINQKQADIDKANKEKIKELNEKYDIDIENLEDDTDQKKLDRQKKRAQEEVLLLVATNEEKAKILNKISEDFAFRQVDLDKKTADEQKIKDDEKAKKDIEDSKKANDKRLEDAKAIREEKLLGIENELSEDNLTYEARKELLKQRETEELTNEELTAQQRVKIHKDTLKAQEDIDKEAYDARVALLGASSQALSMASEVIGKETAVGKGMAVASALMNTYQGISAGVKLGYPQAIPAVAMASLTGFGAVKNILKVKIPNAGVGGTSAPSMTPPPQANPNFNVVGASSTNQIAETMAQQNKQPIKAYVVEQDISTLQRLRERVVNSASMG